MATAIHFGNESLVCLKRKSTSAKSELMGISQLRYLDVRLNSQKYRRVVSSQYCENLLSKRYMKH